MWGVPELHGGTLRLATAAVALTSALASVAAASVAPPTPPVASAAAEQAATKRFARLGLPVYCGSPHKRFVALTFDDGPGLYTPRLLGILRGARARATFFVVGANLHSTRLKRYMRWEAGQGALGDHTWTHALLTALSPAQVAFQIGHTKRAVSQATRAPVSLFRPPYDERDPTIDRIVRSMALVDVLWDVDPRDWATSDWQAIGDRVVAGLRPGAIVILHETRPQTLIALERVILPVLARLKLTAVSIPDLLAVDPPSFTQLREGYGGCAS